jgi:hypothetical protein
VSSPARAALAAGTLLACWLVASAAIAVVGGAGRTSAGPGAGDCAAATTVISPPAPIPPFLLTLYRAAADRYALGPDGWAWLASINAQETDFGRNLSTSSAGAQGWMQFLPATWATYGLDANGDGSADPYDPADAIFAAARYLRALGAPGDWHPAVVVYGGGAEWYFAQVARRAHGFAKATAADCATGPEAAGVYRSPLPPGAPFTNARTDMGVDLETGVPGVGRPLLAIGDAQVLAIKPMGAYGPTWLSYRLLDGPLRGRTIFIGHSGPPLVSAGARIPVGTPLIAIHGGGYGGPPGHLEIGWATPDGAQPAAAGHYREGEVTGEGRDFRRFLARLGIDVCGPAQSASGWC